MSAWQTREAPAKLNLALVVGPRRADGRHEVVTVMERLSLSDTIAVRAASSTGVTGFADDTLVAAALDAVARAAGGGPCFEARIEKRIPVAAGLGGGSSDAAAALLLANDLLDEPLERDELHDLAASLGADVPFFLADGPQLATGDGTRLAPLALPRDYVALLVLPDGVAKASTADVYAAFDARAGERGYDERRAALLAVLGELGRIEDLGQLPANDLARSPLAAELRGAGAFRSDVTGAGPVVYGLFSTASEAEAAASAVAGLAAHTWIATPG
jgi:4-diphosphocytidyl-2-C-methyl-D-erythritol kinase